MEIKAQIIHNEAFLRDSLMHARESKWTFRLWARIVFGAIYVMLIFTGIVALWKGDVIGVFFLIFGCVGLLIPRLQIAFAVKNVRKSPFYNNVIKIVFSDIGLIGKQETADVVLKWPVFTNAIEFTDGILLFQGPNIFNWIPKTALENQDDYGRLLAFVKSKIAKYKVL